MESCDDKSRPPVLVRREKRSSSSPAAVDTSRSPSPSSEHMLHVYPDVIIVERAAAATTSGAGKRRDIGAERVYSRNHDDEIPAMTRRDCEASDDASLKDYAYMYKKDDDDEEERGGVEKGLVGEHDAASDISSVSSSIVDYVRRSLTEVGVSSSRDERPPPLPAKTTTQRRPPPPDDVVANTWEPTHMTWDEVQQFHHSIQCIRRTIRL